MKKVFTNLYLAAAIVVIAGASCKKDSNPTPTPPSYYMGGDEVGRPAVATVFVATADKDNFNATIPSAMSAAYLAKFKTKLLALNTGYTTNALTLTADQFTGLLATDVLNVSASGTTTFFDGTNVLTGRNLSDDVIHTELLLIFGGPAGTSNPTLTDDHVPANDKTFLTSFPYEAAPW
ncbi:MAG TPA: DUF4331 family protein [Puia sp.]|nr:DUF4331 family protein [Puia sp.]